MTLTEFLLARIAEDEDVAREAAQETADEWEYAENVGSMQIQTRKLVGSPGYEYHASVTFDQEGLSDSVNEKAGPHIARFDPARVLAECEAKRRIMDLHEGEHECVSADRHGAVLVAPGYKYWLDPTLLLLALPYAVHPDYREEWKP